MSSSSRFSFFFSISLLLAGLTGVSGCDSSCPDGWEKSGKFPGVESCCPPDDGSGEAQACLPPDEAQEAAEAEEKSAE